MPPPLVPPAPLHAALLDALTQPRATVPLSYFDVLTDPTMGVTHTVLVLATDLYRRCTVNDGPLTVHSLLQRGCGSLATAEALVVVAGARRLLGDATVTASDEGGGVHDVGGGLATPLLPMGASAADVRPIAERAVSFDAWLLRLCYVPRAALARLQTTVLALPVAPGGCGGLPPAGLGGGVVVESDVEVAAAERVGVGEWAEAEATREAAGPWWRCECAWWRWW
jgi:hypothetical protein